MGTTPISSNSSSATEAVHLSHVPGNWFVARSVWIPEGVVGDELTEFIELSLEDMSPFSPEQLYWGYYRAEGSRRALVYAAFDQRLKAQVEALTQADHILPDFGLGFGLQFPQDSLIFILHGSALSGLLYPAKDKVPQMVVSLPVDPEEHEDHQLKAVCLRIRERMQRNLRSPQALDVDAHPVRDASGVSVHDGVLELIVSEDEKGNTVTSLKARDGGEGWSLPELKSGTLWECDIRKPDSKVELRSTRLWNRRLWLASICVAVCFLLLGIMEVGALIFGQLAEAKESRIAARQPEVDQVIEMSEMNSKIRDVTRNQLLPFEMLDAINQMRPQDVYFTKMDTEGSFSLILDGIGQRAESVSEYQRLLNELDFVASAVIENQQVRQNRTTFKLIVQFVEDAIGAQTLPAGDE